ncbi:MAG: hypothetical protein U9P49_09420 [Thermodesulfobacteriota bacterium]|nr:hypothetical protein [Thermodesulfobacteriota bacterium]
MMPKYTKNRRITAKDRHRQTLLAYLANWDNHFPNKEGMAKICGLKKAGLYRNFSPSELNEILSDGLELRKKHSAVPRAEIYASMKAVANEGNVQAQKEFLDRTEGKVLEKHQVGMDESTLNTILATLPPEQAKKTRQALLAISAQKKKS